MWRVEQMRASVVQHRAPARCGWRYAEPQKAEGRLRENRARHSDRRLHDDRLNHVGEDVLRQDPPIACAERSRRFHKLTFFDGEHLRADKARVADPSAEAESEDEVE